MRRTRTPLPDPSAPTPEEIAALDERSRARERRAARRREAEARLRARGAWAYVWRAGVIGWALPAFALVTLFGRVLLPVVWPSYAPESPLWPGIAIGVLTWTVAGMGFGWVRWRFGAPGADTDAG